MRESETFEHGEGKAEDGGGGEVAGGERQGDAADGEERPGAEVGRGFFQDRGDLLDPGVAGPDREGQSPYGISNNQQGQGIGAGVERGVGKGGDVAEGEHQAGHGQGQHGEEVEEGHAPEAPAEQQVSEAEAEEQVRGRGQGGEQEAVADAGEGQRVAEDAEQVFAGELLGDRGEEPLLRAGEQDDSQVREQGQAGQQQGPGPQQQRASAIGAGAGPRR